MKTILLGLRPFNITEDQLARIEEAAPDYRVLLTRDRDEVEAALDDIEIVIGDIPRDVVANAKNLRWWQQWWAGADWLLKFPELQDKDFVLTNASGVHAVPISEHIFALLFAFARRIDKAVLAQSRGEWLGFGRQTVFELYDKTMAVIGVGAIGSRTAEIAKALGMRVLGVRRNPDKASPHVDEMFGMDALQTVLPQADFVIVTVPFTSETDGMFGAAEFEAMKSSAIIVNIGRGKTIQQEAMIAALQRGQIAGAGLDVFAPEPLQEDSPLWKMENVIITGHYSGQTPRYDERCHEIALDNLARYQAGKPLRNVVDKQLGY